MSGHVARSLKLIHKVTDPEDDNRQENIFKTLEAILEERSTSMNTRDDKKHSI